MFARLGRTPIASYSMALLVTINLFNYIDRVVLSAVEPRIREEQEKQLKDAGLPIPSKSQLKFNSGLLASAFLVSYMLLAPIFSLLADRISRWTLVGIGVVLWTLASGASGIDWGLGPIGAFWALLATRCFVGVGEGGYGPIAPAMISDLFAVNDRGKALSRFYVAIPVGGALGYAFSELVMKSFGLTWHWAFYLVVPPGLVLGVLAFFMPDPPRGQMETFQEGTRRGIQKYIGLFHIPSFVLNTLGMTAMCFSIGALSFWMSDYLEYRQVEDLFGKIGPLTVFGGITALSGLLATLIGGWAGDYFKPRNSGSYFLVSGAAMILSFPMILAFVYTPFPYAWIFVFVAVFCLFFNTGPTNTILANVTHPAIRSSGFALNILIIHLFGDVISPPIIGAISGAYGDEIAFSVIATVALVGGILWIWGAAYLEQDTKLAGTRG